MRLFQIFYNGSVNTSGRRRLKVYEDKRERDVRVSDSFTVNRKQEHVYPNMNSCVANLPSKSRDEYTGYLVQVEYNEQPMVIIECFIFSFVGSSLFDN